MSKKRVLVSGSAGFIGSYIQDELIKQGHDVYGFDSLKGGFISNVHPECKFYQIDICDERVAGIVERIKPEILVHVAASAWEGCSFFNPLEIASDNFYGYINVLESCIKAGDLEMVNVFSSMATYGIGNPPFEESDDLAPIDPYGVNKASMEKITKQLSECHGFKYSVTVPHNVFGRRQSIQDPWRNVAGIMMNRIMRGETLYIYGSGEQTRQFSNIKDALPCFMKMIDPSMHGHRVNIGGTKVITVNSLVDMIVKEFKGDYEIPEIIHTKDRHGEVTHAFCCADKSIELLGYADDNGIEEGISCMSEYAKKLGPQEWSKSTLALPNDKCPEIWLKLHNESKHKLNKGEYDRLTI